MVPKDLDLWFRPRLRRYSLAYPVTQSPYMATNGLRNLAVVSVQCSLQSIRVVFDSSGVRRCLKVLVSRVQDVIKTSLTDGEFVSTYSHMGLGFSESTRAADAIARAHASSAMRMISTVENHVQDSEPFGRPASVRRNRP